MHETVTLIMTHVRMVWRFRWWALVIASLVCVLGWAIVIALPDQYRVTTKVYLDTSSMLRPLLRGLAADSRAQEDAALLMRRTLLVRPNLETVARKTDMDLQAKTPEAFDALLTELADAISVAGTQRDNIFVIGYGHHDPQLATRVVEAILNLFVEKSLGESRKDTGRTKQFLDKQIAEYEARLTAAENRLKEFKQRNVGMMPQEGGSYFSRLQAVEAALADAQLQLDEASRRRDEYRRQLDSVQPLFEAEIRGTTAATVNHPLDGRIAQLESNLDNLLLRFTEKHPDVVSTRELIETLSAQRDADIASMPPPAVAPGVESGGAAGNLVQDQLSLALGNAEAEVSALGARVEEFSKRREELRKLVDTVPRIEAELARLDRDYDVTKRNYEELVKRRESLKLAEDANQTSDSVQFNILEPPRVPLTPQGPDRAVYSAGVLVFGLGIGVGLAWLLGMLRPAFYTCEELEQSFGVPVIGHVSRIWTRGERVRRRFEVATFVTGCFVLVGVFSVLVVLEINHSELLAKVRSLDVAERLSQVVDRVI